MTDVPLVVCGGTGCDLPPGRQVGRSKHRQGVFTAASPSIIPPPPTLGTLLSLHGGVGRVGLGAQ